MRRLLALGLAFGLASSAAAQTANVGASNYHVIAGASDNHVVIKNGAGDVSDVDALTFSATKQYVRLYDAGTGFNGCNSATNLIWGMPIPAASSEIGGGFVMPFPVPRHFATGLSICITGAATDTSTTAADTTTIVNVGYK